MSIGASFVLPAIEAAMHLTDAALREEADRLLSSGLREALDWYGEAHVVGSYALSLMVWRDLDIHIVRADLALPPFFELGARIASLLSPCRMHFRNELLMQTPSLPRGLYWGVYLGDERMGAWKVDVWASDRQAFEATRSFEIELHARLTEGARRTILEIKTAVWNNPEYRRSFSSSDIYNAVLDSGVQDVDGFFAYLAADRRG